MTTFTPNSVPGYIVSTFVGLVFGFVMNKARVIEPSIIRDQMTMTHFVMLKLFLTASGTSALSFALLYLIKKTRKNVITAQNNMASLMNRGFLPFIVGGFILGVGLDLAGTCPGMVYVELGAFVENSQYTIMGCLVDIEKLSTSTNNHPKTVMQLTGLSYPVLAVSFAIVMYLIVYLTELYFPWRDDIHFYSSMSLKSYAWSPIIVGAIIGLLQIPLNGLIGKIIGTSVSYMTVCANIYDCHNELHCHKNNWWQVFLCAGSVLGSYISSYLYMGQVNVFNPAIQGSSPVLAFIGGILLLIGAKTMHACTSGHGLSGMPLMAIPSIVATCFIFVGGMTAGFLLNKYF